MLSRIVIALWIGLLGCAPWSWPSSSAAESGERQPPEREMTTYQLVLLHRGLVAQDPAIKAGRLGLELYPWSVPEGSLPER